MKKGSNIHTFVVLAYKESKYLEQCINSVLNQSIKTNVIIATTTNNKFIQNIADKYNLKIVVGEHTSIGGDFDFALNSADSELVTIAHQDDIYNYKYAENIINSYAKYKNSIIIFSDYYEIRNNKNVFSNLNLKIKRLLLVSLRIKKLSCFKFLKRNAIRFGNSICCPAVTFVKNNCPQKVFTSDFKCNCDWFAWEKLSHSKGNFIYISKKLMGHRIDESTTTTDIIRQGIRTKEDYEMYKKFWPGIICKVITKVYKNSERSNKLKKT